MGVGCSECVRRGREDENASPTTSQAGLVVNYTTDGNRTLLHNNSGHDPTADYEDTKSKVAAGGFGVVRMVTSRKTNTLCALKTVAKAGAPLMLLKREVEVNLVVDHPNVVRLYDVYEDRKNVYMVFEVCQGGELLNTILKRKRFSESNAVFVSGQLLWALNYLHAKSIAHRDIKLENLLLKDKGVELSKNTVKLIDFGFAVRFAPGKADMKTMAGSAYYVAPEIIRRKKNEGYTEKCDVWSAGVVMYMLLTGGPPFGGSSEAAIIESVRRSNAKYDGREWSKVSEQTTSLVKSMLERDVPRRVSAAQAVMKWKEIPTSLPASVPDEPTQAHFYERLQIFGTRSHFEQAARHLIARRLDEKTIQGLRNEFHKLDANGDGMLSLEEAKAGAGAAGFQDPTILEEMFAQIDTDGSDQIDYTEFLAAMLNRNLFTEAHAWEAFRVLDRDGDGVIDHSDLKAALGDAYQSEEPTASETSSPMPTPRLAKRDQRKDTIQEMLQEADTNGDGTVDFQEFLAMVRRTSHGSAAPPTGPMSPA
mmetsp:Transcript_156109/g.500721  ORF Transcript_156109/g.500721 Transcript_156109/m.500721 type:complete len:535 (+) Transcript_156109:157-1761(+)|eukprot:CAMPEP_0203970112 /NCGR_PEP_ID=MMETSP0359-20131031/97797_1 /ASSEMBLY_ACC=CAM_ASM_000338 /TAXON_ID=268821 /ORGANISM="Scrippsiella Hangoei, Strain SHTV-5" /LENGTH=534 /DNA_ID=CAMNT_0050908061 /DNA_START=162 /DNA_END=1766 /DNA_ORIENTATION=-